MSRETLYGGGHWTCEKCGRTIFGSSIHHDCRPLSNLIKPAVMETFSYEYNPNMERYISRLYHEWKEYGQIILACDYDDTLSPWKFKDFNYDELFRLIRAAKEIGVLVVVFTSCTDDRYPEIEEYCKSKGVEISAINKNPIDLPYGNERKIYYNHLLDDRAGLMEAMAILSITIMRIKCDAHPNNMFD